MRGAIAAHPRRHPLRLLALALLGVLPSLVSCEDGGSTQDLGREFLPADAVVEEDRDGGAPDAQDARDADAGSGRDDVDGPSDAASTDGDEPDTSGADARPGVDALPSDDAGVVPGATVSIATWNANFLFDTVCDSGACGPDDFEIVYNDAQFRFKARSVAEGIRALNADIVLLQEVENRNALDGVVRELGSGWATVLVTDVGVGGAVNTALLARAPLQAYRTHRDRVRLPRADGGTTNFARELIEATLLVQGQPVVVFNAHFRSQRNDDPERRLQEALATRGLVDSRAAEDPDVLIVLGGDLNDAPGSSTLRALEDDGGLFRVATDLGSGVGTYIYAGNPTFIDHLYVPDAQRARYVGGSARIVRDADGRLAGSDHAGLRAEFVLEAP